MRVLRRILLLASVMVLTLLGLALFGNTAHAADYSVTTTADSGAGSLRQAITDANANPGADTISFNIAGSGVHTITLASALPNITDEVIIDGTTQTGASCGTLVPASLPANSNTPHTLLIEINAGGASGINALNFNDGSNNSIVRGLVMNGANNSASGLRISSTVGSMVVECNYFGTNTAGDTVIANSGSDIDAFGNSTANTIQNNLISGSDQFGIRIASGTIQNNLIGTDASGKYPLANSTGGIFGGSNININNNIVAANSSNGVYVEYANLVTILGNYIGTNIAGSPLANDGEGIRMYGVNNFSIGDTANNERNLISSNTGDGIHIYSDCNSGISFESTIYNNFIGTNNNGLVQSGYGNGAAGIEVNEFIGGCSSVYKHHIGGDITGQPNIIAGNTQQGVLIHQGADNDVFSISTIGNSIYANGQFGIDLASDSGYAGIADTDLGPNALNNFFMSYPTAGHANYYLNRPTIVSSSFSGNQLTINYNYQAPGVQENLPSISSTDVIGYRLDFYLNDNSQDGAYVGYNQGKTHLGSFIVSGSETGASHTFTSPVALTSNMSVNATSTVLWTTIPSDGREGDGPPYTDPTNIDN